MDVPATRFDEPLEARKEAPRPRRQGHRPRRRRPQGARRRVQGDRPRRTPAATSRPTRTSSSTSRSRPSSRRWFGKRARDYRTSQKIADDLGTAVNVVTMVFGNMGDDSGTGVAFTRDPNTGERVLYGEYLTNAQGEDVVAGVRTAPKIAQMATDMPAVYDEFQRIGQQLESHYRDVQDLEFTIERGKLYMLQTRSAKRTAAAAVKIAVDMVADGTITQGRGRRPDRDRPGRPAPPGPVRPRRPARAPSGSPRASTRRPARPSARPSSTPTSPSSGSAAARRSSSSGSRPRPTTSTAWPSPRAS